MTDDTMTPDERASRIALVRGVNRLFYIVAAAFVFSLVVALL